VQLSLPVNNLIDYTTNQLSHFFPDGGKIELKRSLVDLAIDRVNNCFQYVKFDRYCENGFTKLNHLYADHYIVYLWFLANSLWKNGGESGLLNKLYYLNKALHGFDCMFDTGLPDIFLIFHGNGTILGKAEYGNYFISYQGCCVGMHNNRYPTIGEGVTLAANSSLIGGCQVGDRVSVGSATPIFNGNVPSDHTAYRDREGIIRISKSETCLSDQFFVRK
jgi:serine O-acetyltransferase